MRFERSNTNVCSLLHLYYLGGEVVDGAEELGQQWDDDEYDAVIPFDIFLEHLVKLCRDWDAKIFKEWQSGDNPRWDWFGTQYVPKMVIQAVTATPGQDHIEDYLVRIGFTKSGPFSKMKHPGTKLTFWHINGTEFTENIGYVSKYDPRSEAHRKYFVASLKG